MKKTKFLALLTTVFAMGLVACGGEKSSAPQDSSEPAESSVPADSSEQQNSSSANTPSSSATQGSSTPAGGSSSQAQQEGQMTANGIDIIEEGGKVYAKITGTISGFANADAMKMAFGLVKENGTDYIIGSATPADADYKLVPTVADGAFELKVDLSEVQWVGGTYTAMVGPKGAYKAVANSGGTYGTGKAVAGGFRISVRSHNGTIAADEIPPVAMTISRIEVDNVNNKVYHVIGGALNTAALSKTDFLAKHPYVNYEGVANYGKNVMGSSTKTDLVTVSVDEQDNALIKVDITSLGANSYNIKINLNGDSDVDTKMDVVIDERENPVAFGMYDYAVFADSNKSGRDNIYGNCGLFITAANRYVNAGDKFADLQPVKSKEGEIAYEMVAADCVGQNNPKASDKNSRLGKNNIFTDEWEINGIRSGEYEVYVKASYSSGNGGAYWSGALQVANTNDTETDGKNGDPYNPDARYKFQIDTATEVDCLCDKTYAETGLVEANDNAGWTNVAMAKVMIPEGSTSFKMNNSNNGYGLWIYAIRIVRVGNWLKPATEANFTEGVMRVEAESYHEASAEPTIKTDENGTYLDHVGNWPQFNASYKINFAEAKHVKVKLHYAWYSGQWGKYGCAEFTMDGGSKIHDANTAENLGQADENMTGEWLDTESVAFDIAAGEHTFKFQTPGGCTVSWDYFELIVVTE